MEELQLTDNQAQELIKCLKNVLGTYEKKLSNGDKGQFSLKSNNNSLKNRTFQVDYLYATDNIHVNFMDAKTKHTLIRINLDSKFHNNSDGKVRGHRVEIFSESEFKAKDDSSTYVKAHPLPFGTIRDTNDFLIAMKDLLNYTNTHKQNHLQLSIISQLDI